MLDIDHFKNVNDTFGHQVGDVMLQHLGRMLKDYTRNSDIACRYGGEEFALVMPGMSMAKTYQRIEELREAFERIKLNCGGVALQATFSAGIAIYPDHAVTGEELLHLADQALYQAKTAGRNCVKVYDKPTIYNFTRYTKTENLHKVKEFNLTK